MKNKFLFTAITILTVCLLHGCHKSNAGADNKPLALQTLPGTWEMRYLVGAGIAGSNGNYAPGNGNIYRFTDSNFWFYNKGVVYDSGTYNHTTGINPETNTEMDGMFLNNRTDYAVYYNIAGDTLTVYHWVIALDGTIEKYVRIKNPGE